MDGRANRVDDSGTADASLWLQHKSHFPTIGIHRLDNFEPSDWIALVVTIVSLVAIAAPTALFFFERRERIAADAAQQLVKLLERWFGCSSRP